MGIQPSRVRDRIRTKRSQAVPYDVVAPLSPAAILERSYEEAGVCCFPVTIGHFKNEGLVAVYKRHVGRRCAPTVVSVSVVEWRKGRA